MSDPQIGSDGFYDDWPAWAKRAIAASPERDELMKRTWAKMLPPEKKTPVATRSYIAWMRLTHHGKRSPLSPVCSDCGEPMSADEIAEYNAAMARPPGRGRWLPAGSP
jgi:hypothetical protein